jgi:hypothetical protein
LERKISILPTEEFEDINWQAEINRIQHKSNTHIISVWVHDEHQGEKWTERSVEGIRVGLEEAQSWWRTQLTNQHSYIEQVQPTGTDDLVASISRIFARLYPRGGRPVGDVGLPLRYRLTYSGAKQ